MAIDSSGAESRNAKLKSNFEDFSSGHECLLLNLFWLKDEVLSSSSFHPFHLHFSGRWKNSQNWTSAWTRRPSVCAETKWHCTFFLLQQQHHKIMKITPWNSFQMDGKSEYLIIHLCNMHIQIWGILSDSFN